MTSKDGAVALTMYEYKDGHVELESSRGLGAEGLLLVDTGDGNEALQRSNGSLLCILENLRLGRKDVPFGRCRSYAAAVVNASCLLHGLSRGLRMTPTPRRPPPNSAESSLTLSVKSLWSLRGYRVQSAPGSLRRDGSNSIPGTGCVSERQTLEGSPHPSKERESPQLDQHRATKLDRVVLIVVVIMSS